jgi:hypothetical protein
LGSLVAAMMVVFVVTTRKGWDSQSSAEAVILTGVLDKSYGELHSQHSRGSGRRGGLTAILHLLRPSRRRRHRHSRGHRHQHSQRSSSHPPAHSHSRSHHRSHSSSHHH